MMMNDPRHIDDEQPTTHLVADTALTQLSPTKYLNFRALHRTEYKLQ
jgi:hypothetical protein